MRTTSFGWLRAARVAWSVPRTIEHGLPGLLAAPASARVVRAGVDDAHAFVRRTVMVLRLAARLQLRGLRSTCLFRSVAECLALREAGYSAIVKIGVRHDHSGAVLAHAWVECDGVAISSLRGTNAFETLAPTRASCEAAAHVS